MVITKKVRQFFQQKIGATPSVAAPGDTNPSDATVHDTEQCQRRVMHSFCTLGRSVLQYSFKMIFDCEKIIAFTKRTTPMDDPTGIPDSLREL